MMLDEILFIIVAERSALSPYPLTLPLSGDEHYLVLTFYQIYSMLEFYISYHLLSTVIIFVSIANI